MTNIIAQSFKINLLVLKTLCLYTSEDYTYYYKIRASVIFCCFVLHVPILGILYYVLQDEIDLKRLSDNAFVVAEFSCYISKLLPFVTNAEEIRKCIHYLDTLKFFNWRQHQEKILLKASEICRRNSNVFLLGCLGGFVSWAIKPLFSSETMMLPVDIWFPIKVNESLSVYCSVYIWVTLGVGYPGFASSAVDCLVAGLALLTAAYFNVLKDNIQNLYTYTFSNRKLDNQVLSSEESHVLYEEIKKCAKCHEALIRFVALYQKCFSQVVFSQFIGSIFVLGFCCFQVTMTEPFSVEFLTSINYLLILLAQIYFYCYYGSVLFEESNTFVNAVYMSDWYKFDVRSRKALILIMERAKEPVILTAGKLLELSLSTFITILRRSYSFLTVLSNK